MDSFDEDARAEMSRVEERITDLTAELEQHKRKLHALQRYFGDKFRSIHTETYADRLLRMLANGPLSRPAMTAELGCSGPTLETVLSRLKKAGRVQILRRGVWALAEQSSLKVVGGAS